MEITLFENIQAYETPRLFQEAKARSLARQSPGFRALFPTVEGQRHRKRRARQLSELPLLKARVSSMIRASLKILDQDLRVSVGWVAEAAQSKESALAMIRE